MNTQPHIIVSSQDLERLEHLLDTVPAEAFPGREQLRAELERADVVSPEDVPPGVVTMNSTARFTVASSGEELCLTLVYPSGIDGTPGHVSILAPVGSALLGLSPGDEIDWPGPAGKVIHVRLVEATYQPERAGDYHR